MFITQEKRFGSGHNRTQEGMALTPFGGEFCGAIDNRVDLAVQLPLWFQESVRHGPKGRVANDQNVNIARRSLLTLGE
jgi:hypothetical protein